MDSDSLDANLLGQARHFDRDNGGFIPASADFDGQRDAYCRSHRAQDSLERFQIAQQTRAAALDHFFRRASQIDINEVETELLDHAGCARHYFRVSAEQLSRNWVLVRFKEEVARGPRGISRNAFSAREFGHDQAATAEAADHPAKNGVRHSGHRCEDRCRSDVFISDRKSCG